MKLLLALFLMAPAFAQPPVSQLNPEAQAAATQQPLPANEQAPAPAAGQQPAAAKEPAPTPPASQEAAPAKEPAAAKEEKQAESPAPPTEQWLTGNIEFGYRFRTDVAGSFDQYRSVVNLGEGPKLFGLDFSLQDPKRRAFDRIDVRAYGWGGDPYNTAHLTAAKQGTYRLGVDYRDIAYFNAVPSFANPLAPGGFNERSFDIRRRNASFDFELFPGKRIIPYFAYDRNSGRGRGIDLWVLESANEFPVPSQLDDHTDNFRGGIRFEFNRFHVTLEQGRTRFGEDDRTSYNGFNGGDRTTPLLGQNIFLNGLQRAYAISGSGNYSRVMVTAAPWSRLNFYGQFLYSEPRTSVNYTEGAAGNLVALSQLLFYTGQNGTASGSAVQPNTTGNFGFEFRPWNRLRILESVTVERSHDAATGLFSAQLLQGTTPAGSTLVALNPRQSVNYTTEQTDVLFDVTSKLTLRGGYRYLTGDASVLAGSLSQTGPFASGELHRNVGLAGISFRPSQKLWLNLDYEGASSDRVYFRTSLNDYHRARARAKYQIFSSLLLQANFNVMRNENPAPDIRYNFESRDNGVSLYWTPAGGKRVSVTAEYDRSTLSSDIRYLDLPFLAPATSTYREQAHTATAAVDVTLPGMTGGKLTAGGSFFINSGSRPTRYYQPLARLTLPIQKHVYWFTEWQYYGFGERFFFYENFRTHLFLMGLRVTK